MNKILNNFDEVKKNMKIEFTHQFGDDHNSVKLLSHVWESNYNNQKFAWIRSIFFPNFDTLIPKLNSIGIRVYKRNTEDEYSERLLSWSDDFMISINQYECK